IVSTVQLYDASPNPSNGQTAFTYFLPANAKTELRIYDLNGRLVDAVNGPGNAGFNNISYNTSKLSPGTYLYSLATNGKVKTKRLLVTR
ncbi:MAG TPA: T9SS type A sorting domain-containing protein, partial [Chitinophagales bacterium]|nr:T9SS type A sorting domain-containing protein [Chitinophagales bacterium]